MSVKRFGFLLCPAIGILWDFFMLLKAVLGFLFLFFRENPSQAVFFLPNFNIYAKKISFYLRERYSHLTLQEPGGAKLTKNEPLHCRPCLSLCLPSLSCSLFLSLSSSVSL